MKPPIFVRDLSKKERERLEAGLRSKDTLVMRRCQILLASARANSPPKIAENLGCASQTVRNAIRAFDERGLDALTPGSSRPKRVHAAFDEKSAEASREMLHRSPREFGRQSSLWTLGRSSVHDPSYYRETPDGDAIVRSLSGPGYRGTWKWTR
jgi:transposase